MFVFVYSIGAYIKIYDINFKYYWDKVIMILIVVLIGVSVNVPSAIQNEGDLCKDSLNFTQNFLPIIVSAILTFLCFKNLKIKYNKVINYIASLTFPVYLFHENPFCRTLLWKIILKVPEFYETNICLLLIHILLSILYIYGSTFLIEQVRRPIEKLFDKGFEKIKIKKILKFKFILRKQYYNLFKQMKKFI